MTVSLRGIRFDSATGKFARNVAASPRLSAMIDQDKAAELVGAYHASAQSLADARKMLPEVPDVLDMLDSAFRSGQPVNVAEVIAELAEVQVQRDQTLRTVQALSAGPDRYATELGQLINNSADAFVERL